MEMNLHITVRVLFYYFCAVKIAAGTYRLTLLHTNDVHSRIEQTNKYSAACNADDASQNKCYAGMARRKTKVDEIRNQTQNVLLLDAGDQFQGTVWFNYYAGNATSHFMNRLQYDAMVS